MDWIRTYWPTLLGVLLCLYFLLIAFRREGGGEAVSRWRLFRERNREGAFFAGILILFLLLLVGAQLGMRRTAGEYARFEERTGSWGESIRAENQEWSIRYRRLEVERDSLRSALERIEEMEDAFRLEGEVVDEATGRPIPSAQIAVFRYDPDRKVRNRLVAREISCDERGRFSVQSTRPGPAGSIRLEIRADGYPPSEKWIPSAELESPHTFSLSR